METQLLDAVPAWNHGTQEGGVNPGAAWEAVAKIQDAVQRIEADSEADTGQYTYRYLSFEALQTALRPHFEAADVMVVQSSQPCPYPGDIDVRTRFRHKSGGWVEFGLIMPRGVDGQKAGGIFTYAKRYALGAALNIAIGKDDDARAASPPQLQPKTCKQSGSGSRRSQTRTCARRRPRRLTRTNGRQSHEQGSKTGTLTSSLRLRSWRRGWRRFRRSATISQLRRKHHRSKRR